MHFSCSTFTGCQLRVTFLCTCWTPPNFQLVMQNTSKWECQQCVFVLYLAGSASCFSLILLFPCLVLFWFFFLFVFLFLLALFGHLLLFYICRGSQPASWPSVFLLQMNLWQKLRMLVNGYWPPHSSGSWQTYAGCCGTGSVPLVVFWRCTSVWLLYCSNWSSIFCLSFRV